MVSYNAKPLPIEEDVWGSLLNIRTISAEKGTLIILGDDNAGKSSLLAKLKGGEIPALKHGHGLSYEFMQVYEDNSEEPTGDLDIWILEGEVAQIDLLKSTLKENVLSSCMVVICLDFSNPWRLVDSLDKWLDCLRTLVDDIRGRDCIAEKKLIHYLHCYKEPASDAMNQPKRRKSVATINTDEILAYTDYVKFNLGLPIAIVCCKSDSKIVLEKYYDPKLLISEFIQLQLRTNFGLINIKLTKEDIEHRIFGMEFRQSPLLESDSVFVPSGWDSIEKIKTDAEANNIDWESSYSSVVKQRFDFKVPAPLSIIADDDMVFLTKHKILLDKQDEESPHAFWRDISPSSSNHSGTTTTSPSLSHRSFTIPSPLQIPTSNKTPPTTPNYASPSARDKQVLATFFDALLRSTSPVKPPREDVVKEMERLKTSIKK